MPFVIRRLIRIGVGGGGGNAIASRFGLQGDFGPSKVFLSRDFHVGSAAGNHLDPFADCFDQLCIIVGCE